MSNVTLLKRSKQDFTKAGALNDLLQELSTVTATSSLPLHVDLSASHFASRSDYKQLLQALTDCSSLAQVNLSSFLCSDYLPEDGSLTRLLAENKTLTNLDLAGLSLSCDAVSDLCNGLKNNSTLRELNLHGCSLDDNAAALILESLLQHDSLHALDLGANGELSNHFANTKLASFLKQTKTLKSIGLDHASSIFESDVGPFLQALEENTTLQSLSLRYCTIKENIGKSILTALTLNHTLQELNLEFSGFGLRDQGNKILVDLLPQLHLKTLKILVKYPEELVPSLITALQKNMSLQTFRPRVDQASARTQVQTLLARNKNLALSQQFLKQQDAAPIALLPLAMASLATEGACAANYQLLTQRIVECNYY